MIRQLRRSHPTATLVATGCYSELEPEEVRALGVSLVVTNHDKDRLPQLLEEEGLLNMPVRENGPCHTGTPINPARRTRAFVKVQDGCDNRCTFCIVTVARGAGRSRPAEQVVNEVPG